MQKPRQLIEHLGRRVAAYMRMSSKEQIGSIPNQRLALSIYALSHNMEIIREYVDHDKSGLTFEKRAGLRSLIHDVTGGTTDFDAVLVYDVNRWGRFQDIDESAHYEFVCEEAGVKVIYCKELFQSDGSISSVLMKTFRRMKAAEDSRELSAKVFQGQLRLAKLGYKQGGPAGYGLRRISVEQDGTMRRQLAKGERKGAITDRVILAHGPDHEVAIVRKIYDWYICDKLNSCAIARLLNARGIPCEYGRLWTDSKVISILTNEKYIGTLVYNRVSKKLQSRAVANPRKEWVRKRNAFPALVDAQVFQRAQQSRRYRHSAALSNDELLDMLRRVHNENGDISAKIIKQDSKLPNYAIFRERFGGMKRAYKLAGVQPRPSTLLGNENERKTIAIRNRIFLKICEYAIFAGGAISPGDGTNTFMLNAHILVRLHVTGVAYRSNKGHRWVLELQAAQGVNFLIAVLLEPMGSGIKSFYLFPREILPHLTFTLQEEHLDRYVQYQYSSLEEMFGL